MYLRHETKLPYRKLQKLMSDLFGLNFVAASSLGFEKRARTHAPPIYEDLIQKMCHCDLVHADESYWREDGEVFAFIRFGGPPTNNHAQRALRPLVIIRKVCLGSRSRTGSENVTIFSSLAQTAKLQNGNVLNLFESLFGSDVGHAHTRIFPNTS